MKTLFFSFKGQFYFKTNQTSKAARDFLCKTFLGNYNAIPVMCKQIE